MSRVTTWSHCTLYWSSVSGTVSLATDTYLFLLSCIRSTWSCIHRDWISSAVTPNRQGAQLKKRSSPVHEGAKMFIGSISWYKAYTRKLPQWQGAGGVLGVHLSQSQVGSSDMDTTTGVSCKCYQNEIPCMSHIFILQELLHNLYIYIHI